MFHIARAWKQIVLASSILLTFANLVHSTAHAQESSSSSARDSLPNAPQPAQVTSQPGEKGSLQTGTGNISGTVLDTRGDVLQGAKVTLAGQSGSDVRTVESGNDGQFAFTSLAPDAYRITVTAPGMNRFTSTQILLHAGEFRLVPAVTLSVSGGSTSVTVTGNKEELSLEQVQIAVQQRVVGVIPNFYSTYDWNAPPMEAKQKFQLSFRSIIDPVSFLVVAGIAGAEQYQNIFPDYGGGIEGYGKRYGAGWRITFRAPCWAKLSTPQFSIRTHATSIRGREASARARYMRCPQPSSPGAMTDGGSRTTRMCSATSQQEPFRTFTIQLPIAELHWSC